jgi:hypothetical protein
MEKDNKQSLMDMLYLNLQPKCFTFKYKIIAK